MPNAMQLTISMPNHQKKYTPVLDMTTKIASSLATDPLLLTVINSLLVFGVYISLSYFSHYKFLCHTISLKVNPKTFSIISVLFSIIFPLSPYTHIGWFSVTWIWYLHIRIFAHTIPLTEIIASFLIAQSLL